MRKFFLFLLISNSILFSQTLLLEENFNYGAGTLSTVGSAVWTVDTGTIDANVVDGNLFYSGYSSSNIGRQLQVSNSQSKDYYNTIGAYNSGTVYYSFLLNVTNETGLSGNATNGDYCMHLGGAANASLLYIKKGSTSLKFQIGIAKKTASTPQYLSSNELNYGTTYLIIISYTFNSVSTTDDLVQLWVNPSLSGSQPTADISFTDTQTDNNNITKTCIRQTTNTPNAFIDGIRVATDWSLAPLPVELTSFTSKVIGDKVHLNWQTATEVNNYGFEIERGQTSKVKNETWERIGFIHGNGNSNSEKNYSFIDEPKNGKEFKYRLKQIDFNGSFEYSKEETVILENISFFKLEQNYPNPFNPVTKISYTIPQRVSVKLRVYDMLAKKIAELVNGFQEEGRYEVTFDGSNYPSGTYFYKLEAGSYVEVKKLLLIK